MDVSLKSSERKSFVVEPFDNEENRLISVSDSSDGIILSENKSEQYAVSKNQQLVSCETINCSEICVNEADGTKQVLVVFSSTVLNASDVSEEKRLIDNVHSLSEDRNTVSFLDVTKKTTKNGCEMANEAEELNKISVTNSETNDDLSICTVETDELLMTCNEKAETTSNDFSKNVCPNKFKKNENRVDKTGGNQLLQIIYEIENFFDAINSTNKDMRKKSGILVRKQNLVDEIISYIHAVQSVIRLSTSRSLFSRSIRKNSMVVNRNKLLGETAKPFHEVSKPIYEATKPFYEAGEHILEELGLYRRELQEDFKVWEAYRKEILEISDQMPDDFEYCENEMSAKILMHEISTRICNILRHMEMITSKREDKNENCTDLMDSVDTYIRYSSAFIMGNRALPYF